MFFGVRSVFSDLLVFRSKFCPALLLFWSFWVQVRHLFFKWFAFGLVLVGWFDVDFFFSFLLRQSDFGGTCWSSSAVVPFRFVFVCSRWCGL